MLKKSFFCFFILLNFFIVNLFLLNYVFGQNNAISQKLFYNNNNKYKPEWKDLDQRPLPQWYDKAKFGIFIHWGVFSVPSFGSEWFWNNWKESDPKLVKFMNDLYKPGFTYQEFAKDFTAEFFNATEWSELFKASGAKYIVLTSKHHEGYTLWPSKYSFSWNSLDIGPHRDIVGELSEAIRKNTDIKFGLYHSLYEWFNPLYLNDKKNNFETDTFVTNKILPELKELVELYKPEVIWSDGDWESSDTYWKSKEFLSWLYSESPVKDTVVANDRWGSKIPCHHGDFYTCSDRYNPGILQKHKWENCMTIDRKSWGYRRNAALKDYMSIEELVKELVVTVSCGGNLLMNVGPTKYGIISPIFEERLMQMGKWLNINGKAIYDSVPWKVQNDSLTGDVWYTTNSNKELFASFLSWPKNNTLLLKSVSTTSDTKINVLGTDLPIPWSQKPDYIEVMLPPIINKGQPAWVLQLVNIK